MQDFNYTLVANLNSAKGSLQAHGNINLQESLVIPASDLGYFRNLSMAASADGSLSLIEKLHRKLAHVQALELQPDRSDCARINVVILGLLSGDGLTLAAPHITRQGREFSILVAEALDESAQADHHGESEFSISIPLDVSELESGPWVVQVNGLKRKFVLMD